METPDGSRFGGKGFRSTWQEGVVAIVTALNTTNEPNKNHTPGNGYDGDLVAPMIRDVGLALAKAAISMGRKVAFAFGCSDAEGIRLHYGAAKDFTRDRRSGAIRRVDNSVGDRVEIIISDLKSYIPDAILTFQNPKTSF